MISEKFMPMALVMAVLLLWMPLKGQESENWNVLSPGKARNYSLFATLTPMAAGVALVALDQEGESGIGAFGALLFWAGGTFGPGTGYLYAHHPWGFWRGVLIRTVGIGGMIAGLAISWDDPYASGGWEFFIAGSTLYIGSGIFDIFNSAKSARNYNNAQGLSLSLNPCYIASKKAPGLMFSVRF